MLGDILYFLNSSAPSILLTGLAGYMLIVYTYVIQYLGLKKAYRISREKNMIEILKAAKIQLIHKFIIEIGEKYRSAIKEYIDKNPKDLPYIMPEKPGEKGYTFFDLLSAFEGYTLTKDKIANLLKEGKIKIEEEIFHGAETYRIQIHFVRNIIDKMELFTKKERILLMRIIFMLITVTGLAWLFSTPFTEGVFLSPDFKNVDSITQYLIISNAFILLFAAIIRLLGNSEEQEVIKAAEHINKLELKIGRDFEESVKEVVSYVRKTVGKA